MYGESMNVPVHQREYVEISEINWKEPTGQPENKHRVAYKSPTMYSKCVE